MRQDGIPSPVSINMTQKSQRSVVGSPTSGSPPLPEPAEVCPTLRSMPKVSATERSNKQQQQLQQMQQRLSSGKSKSGMRSQSASGGMQMVLDETGSWSDLADKSTPGHMRSKPSGMLGFFSKRKGRASSPKPQERGVLGREGARVVIA